MTKADKRNTMVIIIEKSDYLRKVERYVAENGWLEVKKDPSEKYQQATKGCDEGL
jgi:hypothetical protein